MTETSLSFEGGRSPVRLALQIAGHIVLEDSRGDVVNSLREKAALTQRELAGLLNTSRERVSRVENGHVKPSVDFVEGLSRCMAFAEFVRELDVRGDFEDRTVRRAANSLDLDEEAADLLVIKGLASLNEKRKGLIREMEDSK